MRRISSRSHRLAVTFALATLGLLAVLPGCGGGSASSPGAPPPSAGSTANTDTGSPADAAASSAGAVLDASGGFTGHVVGTFHCTTTDEATVVTMTAGATSLVIRAVGGKVVEGAYLSVGQDYGGPVTPPGQGGTLTLKGSSATLANVQIPSRKGGTPMILNGTITCR